MIKDKFKPIKIVSSKGEVNYIIRRIPAHLTDAKGELLRFELQKDALDYIKKITAI